MRQRIEGSNPFLSAKPVTIVTGFFDATQRRKLAFESWGALKKSKSAGEFLIHQHSLKGFGKRARFGMTTNEVRRPSKLFGKRARFGMLERSDSNHIIWDDDERSEASIRIV